ncbi:hypothetical protein [Saccharibacillus sp. JS10]|uniref:hypothetical protein n=1 Tax=Saccharibacillus sp. JS10 TaxID=2950552 RepID=UPI00210EE050|nr:hypothetical protein [Saccharibacillus sp. JS10]MCQ4087536.1 hypothetical protein [Saccharibacillus sp. JS10]
MSIEAFLTQIILLLRTYRSSLEHLWSNSPTKKLLAFIFEIDIKRFAVASTGHDFIGLFDKLLNIDRLNEDCVPADIEMLSEKGYI